MISTVQHALYGKITYDENFWTGKKAISINGVNLVKEQKNIYSYENGGNKIKVVVRGNFVMGVKLVIAEESIEMTKAATWYEIACSVAMFAFVLAWGNSVYLCSIVPIIGGAMGGFVGCLMSMVNLVAMKSIKNVAAKLAIWLAMFIATFGICFVLALIFLTTLA